MRLGVFVVFAIWVIDKFLRPEHTQGVWDTFYFIKDIGPMISYAAGVAQGAIVLGFLLGFAKRITYGLVFIMHLIGTVTPVTRYLAPFESVNILFYAAWPMLAACAALYLLREYDTMLSPFSPKSDN